MNQIHAMAHYRHQRIVELTEETIVPSSDHHVRQANQIFRTVIQRKRATMQALTVAAIGILLMPIFGVISSNENLSEKLQALIENERAASGKSAVLAVDTSGLSVRSTNVSPSTKELFEQAAVEHLAKLHNTYSIWAETNQELKGSLLIKLTVDPAGNVARVDPVSSQLTNSSFIETILADMREWKFPKGSAEAAEITVPMLFIPKGIDAETVVQWERTVRVGGPQGITPPSRPADSNPITLTQVIPPEKFTSASPVTPNPSKTVFPSPATGAKSKPEPKALSSVKANRALTIRDNPRYSANPVREVGEDTRLSVLEDRGDWLKVKMASGGLTGFIRKEYVSPTS